MVVPEIMFSSFCWKGAVRSSLKLLTPVVAQTIAPYNIYSIKFVKLSFRAIKVIFFKRTCETNAACENCSFIFTVCVKSVPPL